MLVQLVPEQISNYWPQLSKAIRISLPPNAVESDDGMNNILEACLGGQMRVWTLMSESKKVYAVVVTMFSMEPMSKTKNLLIYALYGFTKITDELWKSGLQTLRSYAKANGCSRIIGYTDTDRIVELTKSLGGSVAHTVYLEV